MYGKRRNKMIKKYEFKIIQAGYGKTLEEAFADALLTLASQDMPVDEAVVLSEEDAPYMNESIL